MLFHLNGQFTDEPVIPATDGAFLFGDSLFETLLARGKRVRFLAEHLDRIELSARLLSFPFDRARAEAATAAVAGRLEAPASRLRLTITRGPFATLDFPPPDGAGQILAALPCQEPSLADRETGASCLFAPNRRVNPLSHLPQMKRGNYADCLYAANFARRRGAREALFTTEDGRLLEGATSNLFLVAEGILLTPPAGELVLPGIMRRQVLRAAARLGIGAEEREIGCENLFGADEAFLTNALIGILPIAGVEGRPIARGGMWRQLWEEVEAAAII